MTNLNSDMRGLSSAEIDGVAGGFAILLSMLQACGIEYNLQGGSKSETTTQTEATGDTGTNDTGDSGNTGDTGGDKK